MDLNIALATRKADTGDYRSPPATHSCLLNWGFQILSGKLVIFGQSDMDLRGYSGHY